MADTPSSASLQPDPAPATVTDHRPVPRGVLPRGVQTWVMAGVAVGMLAIMLIVGRPNPPARPAATAASAQPPSADRVRDYQDRLRLLEAQALRDAQDAGPTPVAPSVQYRRCPSPGAAGSDCGRSKTTRVRKPVCQQCRPKSAARDRAAGPPTQHRPDRGDGAFRSVQSVGRRRRRRRRPSDHSNGGAGWQPGIAVSAASNGRASSAGD